MAEKKRYTMKTVFGIWWYTFIVGFVICLMLNAILPNWSWYALFGMFLISEAIGVLTPSPKTAITNEKGETLVWVRGDTLSESVWTFIAGHMSRRIFGAVFGIAVVFAAWHLFEITAIYAQVEYTWRDRLPWDVFCGGLGAWLVGHFFFEGRHG